MQGAQAFQGDLVEEIDIFSMRIIVMVMIIFSTWKAFVKVTQYKKSAESKLAQGRRRWEVIQNMSINLFLFPDFNLTGAYPRYDRKQQGFGGQSKPILRKKAKTTKKLVLKMECTVCKWKNQVGPLCLHQLVILCL